MLSWSPSSLTYRPLRSSSSTTNTFSHSYDGEDAAPNAEPPSEQGFQPGPAPIPPPKEIPKAPDPTPIETKTEDEHLDGGEYQGNGGGGWNGFQGNGGSSSHFQSAPVEESRPIGIKEDG